MAVQETSLGLNCPNCGGRVPVPEGQVIVTCPYCEMRSLVRGERGLPRYQVPQKIDRPQAVAALKQFFTSHQAIARDVSRQAQLSEAFIAYLPFWASWARVMGWIFGQKRVRRNDHTYYEPREIKFARELSWNGAACDVGEFGVETVPLADQPLEPFDADSLHTAGMVFEPLGSVSQATEDAQNSFVDRLRQAASLDRIAQIFVRFVRERFGLVYYPLWILRYLYRGRVFQVAVDAYSGQVLYGKAPGNTFYRAAVLVGGMALGSILAVDGAALAFALAANSDGDSAGAMLVGGLVAIVVGFGIIGAAYRNFRYGEQYEYRRAGGGSQFALFQGREMLAKIEDLDTWINLLS